MIARRAGDARAAGKLRRLALPAAADVTVETVRPDGARQTFSMRAREFGLESDETIPEPHEFAALVRIGEQVRSITFEEHAPDPAHGHQHRDNNMRAAVVHVMADAAVSVVRAARQPARLPFTLAAVAMAAAWCATLPARWREWPGQGPSERRDVQIARGLDLRTRGVAAAHVTPCSFEHFALLAAWGQPEKATVAPRTGATPTSDCPKVTER